MKKTLFSIATLLFMLAVLLTGCSKKDDIINPQPLPVPPPPVEGFFSIQLRAAITVGDVLYDSIPATFTITTWDADGVAQAKDTALNAGPQVIYLPKQAARYSLKLQKWGIADEKLLTKAEVTEGAIYQLGGHKEAKKLKWVTEDMFVNGTFSLSAKQHFVYDEQGRINEVLAYAPDPGNGILRQHSSDLFLYGGNELWVNNVNSYTGVMSSHNAYTFDAQGRTIQSKYTYRTENHIYSNHYTSEGILMLMGANATDLNGSRIALKFTGGNRVEEKTIITNYPTTVKNFRFDFNINPFAIIKFPSLYFEHSSKNNVIAERWEGNNQLVNEYKYDADGYITEVTTKFRSNTGQMVSYSRTTYTY